MSAEDLIAEHASRGRTLNVAGVETFVREQGSGEAVVFFHGVPVSSFLWRKVLDALEPRGLRGIAYDLPGLGLSARPSDYDYSWTGLGQHARALIDSLGLARVHLVVHDIGGPVGFELASQIPERVASLTLLNTLVEVASFQKPPVMRPFELPVIGEFYLRSMIAPLFIAMMYAQGISDRDQCPPEQLLAHLRLLKRVDAGRAFLKIMRAFEPTEEKQARYVSTVQGARYPVQAVWGARDPALTLARYGAIAKRLVGPDHFYETPGKHFLQETDATAIAERVVAIAAS